MKTLAKADRLYEHTRHQNRRRLLLPLVGPASETARHSNHVVMSSKCSNDRNLELKDRAFANQTSSMSTFQFADLQQANLRAAASLHATDVASVR